MCARSAEVDNTLCFVSGFQVTVLQERCVKLEDLCKARYEAGEKSQAYSQFQDKYNAVSSVQQGVD